MSNIFVRGCVRRLGCNAHPCPCQDLMGKVMKVVRKTHRSTMSSSTLARPPPGTHTSPIEARCVRWTPAQVDPRVPVGPREAADACASGLAKRGGHLRADPQNTVDTCGHG